MRPHRRERTGNHWDGSLPTERIVLSAGEGYTQLVRRGVSALVLVKAVGDERHRTGKRP